MALHTRPVTTLARWWRSASPDDRRWLAGLIVHLRANLIEGHEHMATGDIAGLLDHGAHHVAHLAELRFRLGIRDHDLQRLTQDRIGEPARRMTARSAATPDATVSDIHPGDATSAPERDVPATVRQFPQRGDRRP